MAKKREPWREIWKRQSNLGGGGQGSTTLVKNISDGSDGTVFVQKVLNKQDDIERRRRMYREVAILETLIHPGIPKLVQSNAAKHEDMSEALYLVTEYIDGPTLEEFIQGRGKIELSEAVQLVLRLLDVVEYCHTRGVVHRDIKPDNIIVRNGDAGDPVLLDFGLSFNNNDDNGPLTPSQQQLGNRFYHLPELEITGTNRRDPRSDVAQCCAILFYMLTGKYPVAPLNEDNLKPHQRSNVEEIWNVLPDNQRAELLKLFDRGLEQSIDHRFQSVAALRAAVQDTMDPRAAADRTRSFDDRAKNIKSNIETSMAASPGYQQRKKGLDILQEVDAVVRAAQNEVAEALGSSFGTSQSSYRSPTLSQLKYSNRLGIVFEPQDRRFEPWIDAWAEGSELVVMVRTDKPLSAMELYRAAVNGPKDWEKLKGNAKDYYLNGVRDLFQGSQGATKNQADGVTPEQGEGNSAGTGGPNVGAG